MWGPGLSPALSPAAAFLLQAPVADTWPSRSLFSSPVDFGKEGYSAKDPSARHSVEQSPAVSKPSSPSAEPFFEPPSTCDLLLVIYLSHFPRSSHGVFVTIL